MAGDFGGYVDVRASLRVVGSVLLRIAVTPLLPAVVALVYGESPIPFLAMAVATAGLGFGLQRLHPQTDIGHRLEVLSVLVILTPSFWR